MSNIQSNDASPAHSSLSAEGTVNAGTPSAAAVPVDPPMSNQELLNTISNESIPQEYLDVAKLMMLSKTMYNVFSLGPQGYFQTDMERTKLNQEIQKLKAKGEADEMKILQLQSDKMNLEQSIQELEDANETKISQLKCDKAALEEKVRELETANQMTTAEKEKLATNLEVCEGEFGKATARIENLEVNVKEKDTEITRLKNKINVLEDSAAKTASLLQGVFQVQKESEEAISSMGNLTVQKEEINGKENNQGAVAAKAKPEKKRSKRQAKNDGQGSKKGKYDATSE